MQELDDNALLRRYNEQADEEAFAALVARHVNKVYSIARRHTNNPHNAEEITQAVFVILARKCRNFGKGVILSGWLCETTRLTALTFIRGETRRARREQEAYMQTSLDETESEVWPQIAPLLDAGMAGLSRTDHLVMVLRFYDNKSMKEVGAALGTNENAAKMRVSRAVEKLRQFFSKRGVVLSGAAIAGAISANSVHAAPAFLATTTTAVAIAKGATASSSTLTLSKGVIKLMAWTKAKTAIIAGASVLLAAGTATVAVKTFAANRPSSWQETYDPSFLKRLPPQITIRPSLPSTVQSHLHVGGSRLALGQSVDDLLMAAYWVHPHQIIWKTPMPEGKYDFLANLPGDDSAAVRKTITRTFGLSLRREVIETNVLILTVQSPAGPGLQPASGESFRHWDNGYYSAHGPSIYALVDYLERVLNISVIDQTKLKGDFNIDLKFDGTPEGLKRAVFGELGLQLTPGRKPVEFLIVEKGQIKL